MAKEKRYFWLQLKENFFDDDAMEWLEEQDNGKGKEYCLFYLKLCLKSLKSREYIIQRQVGDIIIPYDIQKIAEITKTDVDVAKRGLEKLKQIGFIQVLDSGGLYMTQVQYMVGSECASAERQRRSRANKAVTMSHDSHTNVTIQSQYSNDNVTGQSHLSNTEKEIRERDKSQELDSDIDFSSFWFEYPRKLDEDRTYYEWKLVIENGYKKADLVQSAINYASTVIGYSPQYIKHPKNFLADKSFVDYLPNVFKLEKRNVVSISKNPNNKFNQFPQRHYTAQEYQEIERKLINKGL